MPWNFSTAMRCKCLNDSDLGRDYLTLWSVAFTKRGLQDVAIVIGLDELAPVGGRPASGESSTIPLAPGRVDFRCRPGPTQVAALCRGST